MKIFRLHITNLDWRHNLLKRRFKLAEPCGLFIMYVYFCGLYSILHIFQRILST